MLVALAGTYRIATLPAYLHDPHLIIVSLIELPVMLATAAARAHGARPITPRDARAVTA